jgi:hypothetical protein
VKFALELLLVLSLAGYLIVWLVNAFLSVQVIRRMKTADPRVREDIGWIFRFGATRRLNQYIKYEEYEKVEDEPYRALCRRLRFWGIIVWVMLGLVVLGFVGSWSQ